MPSRSARCSAAAWRSALASLPRPRSLSSQLIEPLLVGIETGAYAPSGPSGRAEAAATIAADLARKARTPTPPRRVQAPKQRTAQPSEGRRRRLFLIAGVAAVIAVVAIGAVLVWIPLR